MTNTAIAVNITPLAQEVTQRLAELVMNKAELALKFGCSRSMVSQYLNGKYQSDPTELEAKFVDWLAETRPEAAESEAVQPSGKEVPTNQKIAYFESEDYVNTIGLCTACQNDMALGIIVGKSGYGKTYSLRQYSRMPRVIYIECNESMSCRDVIRRIEKQIGLPKIYGTNDERLERIIDYFTVNNGYLLIVDEADKLINKYTIKKIELLRNIADGADVGIVIAGEPALESYLKGYDERFAKRMDFYYKLHGLTRDEIQQYLKGFDVDEEAVNVLAARGTNSQNGCFRLFDRTLNNVLRILQAKKMTRINMKVINEASSMMML